MLNFDVRHSKIFIFEGVVRVQKPIVLWYPRPLVSSILLFSYQNFLIRFLNWPLANLPGFNSAMPKCMANTQKLKIMTCFVIERLQSIIGKVHWKEIYYIVILVVGSSVGDKNCASILTKRESK